MKEILPIKSVVVTLTRNEITFAVDFETAKVAQSVFMSAESKLKEHAEQTLTGKETKDWLDRQIEDAYRRLRQEAAPYIDEVRCLITKDTIDWRKREWVIALRMPGSWMSDGHELSSVANRYVVSYCLREWYQMVDPKRSDIYNVRMGEAMRLWRDCLHKQVVTTKYW